MNATHHRYFSLKSLLRQVSIMAVLQAASTGLTLLTGVTLARALGPAELGVYALAMSITAILGLFSEFGLPQLTSREVAKACATENWDLLKSFVRWSTWFITLTTLFSVGAFWVLYQLGYIKPERELLATMFVAISLIPIIALLKLRSSGLLGMGQTGLAQFPLLVLRPGLFFGFLILIVIAGWLHLINYRMTSVSAMACQLFGSLGALAFASYFFRRQRPDRHITRHTKVTNPGWLAATVPMAMTEGLRGLLGQMAVLMIGTWATTTDVGVYRVADAMFVMICVPVVIVNITIVPTFASLHSTGNLGALRRSFAYATLLSFAGTAFLTVIIILFGPQLIHLAFGAKFVASYRYVIVLASGFCVASALGPVSTYVNMTGRERYTTVSCLIAVTFDLIIMFVTVPRYGAIAAAYCSALTYLVWFGLLAIFVRVRDGFDPSLLGSIGPVGADISRFFGDLRAR